VAESVRSSFIAAATACTSSGGTTTAASPAISGKAPADETIAGQPHAIASSGGKPNPS
jgi:hypothetical protein